MIIAVSGNVGSGKTTLAKYISEKYCFDYIPQHRLEFDFIDDFFNDIEGKFFPAQVSFLLSKAIELQELYTWLETIFKPAGNLKKAITYSLNQREFLYAFLDHGEIDISSN